MLNVTHVHTVVALVVDEHRQTAAISSSLLASSEHQMDVAVAVGNETLHTIQSPTVVLLVTSCLEHHALQVTTSVWLSEVHGHALTCTHAWDESFALLLAAELIQCVNAALQRPDVLETGICRRNHLTEHREHHIGNVQTAITTRHGHTVKTCLARCVNVLECLAGIDHATVLQMWTFLVDALAVGLEDGLCHLAANFQQATVVFDGVVVVDGCIRIGCSIDKAFLLQLNDPLHERMAQLEVNLLYIILSHFFLNFSSSVVQ